MNDTVHFAEHTVTKKYEGKYKRARLLAIVGVVAFFVLLLIIMLMVIGAGAFIWYVPLSPTAIFLSKKLVYDRFFNTEYNYTIARGTLTLKRVNSDRYEKVLTTLKLSEARAILPYTESYRGYIDGLALPNRIEAVSSMSAPDIYAIESDDTLIFIEGISKTVKLLKYFNSNAVIEETAV